MPEPALAEPIATLRAADFNLPDAALFAGFPRGRRPFDCKH